MSRWLSSVNSLLTQLDGQAEIVAEEHLLQQQQDENNDDTSLDNILTKRGLSSVVDDDDDDEEDAVDAVNATTEDGWDASSVDLGAEDHDGGIEGQEDESGDILDTVDVTAEADEELPSEEDLKVAGDDATNEDKPQGEVTATPDADVTNKGTEDEQSPSPPPTHQDTAAADVTEAESKAADGADVQAKEDTDEAFDSDPASADKDPEKSAKVEGDETKNIPPSPAVAAAKSSPAPTKTAMPKGPLRPPSSKSNTSPPTPPPQQAKNMIPKSEFIQMQKEARTLRRHVVSLNSQLEAAESELKAQRGELEQAADRMQKDRAKTKKQIEDIKQAHAKQIATMTKQHEDLLIERHTKMELEREQYKAQILTLESKRQQEGGDWNKELSVAAEKQQQDASTILALEDEKAVLLSQISTLQSQQEALGSRLESLTQTSDNAMEREREAEERLDAMLTQHARQIAQRQAREAELEKTVQELGAALVAAQSAVTNASTPKINVIDGSTNKARSFFGEGDTGAGDPLVDPSALKTKIETLEHDLSNAHSQLDLERERSQALHQELRDLSKETTQEASAVHARQVHHDRQIADLNLTISKLQANLRRVSSQGDDSSPEGNAKSNAEAGLSKEVHLLSEEVIRLRAQLGNQNSEMVTLKNRVKSAKDRANQAENELAMALANNNNNAATSDSAYDNMERNSAPTSGTGLSRRRRNAQSSSIRAAIQLQSGQGDRAEQIGKAIDVVDEFAVSTGKYLRRNPLARAGFLMYLVLLHSWSFFLLFFHAHSFETVHGDFGAGIGVAHGPHALMQKSEQISKLPPVTPKQEGDATQLDKKVVSNLAESDAKTDAKN